MLTFGKSRICTVGLNSLVNNLTMSKSSNSRLRNYNCVTNATVLTFGKSGFGTSRSYRLIDSLGMRNYWNNLLLYFLVSTAIASNTLGKTGGSTGGFYAGNNNLVVSKSRLHYITTVNTCTCISTVSVFALIMRLHRNNFLGDKCCITYRTLLTFSETCASTSSIDRINNCFFVSESKNKYYTTNCTYLIGGTSCIGTFSMSLCGNLLDSIFSTTRAVNLLRTNFGTSGLYESYSCAFFIMYNFPTVLCRKSKRNFYIAGTLNKLICFGLGTVLDLNSTISGNICTTGGSINATCGCIDCTINYNLSIYKVCIGSSVFSTGSITYRNKSLISRTTVLAPVISIVNVNVISASKGTLSTLADNNLGTGKECNILVDCDITGHRLNSHVVLNTELVVLRIDAGCTNAHIDGRNGYVSIRLDNKSVCILIIILNNVSTCKVEHSTATGNKCYCRAEIGTRHINGSVRILCCAGIESKRNFNILKVVLRKREYTILHIGRLCTATEVHYLEILIYTCALICNNRTLTNDKSICIKSTTVIHGNRAVSVHSDNTHTISRATA